jgi:predicted nucleic acid-binding protein
MDLIVDTNVLSYQFKGIEKRNQSERLAISSITANEFLVAKSDYYIIQPSKNLSRYFVAEDSNFVVPEHFKSPKGARMGASRTDQLVIDFNNQFPPYRYLGNEAIAEIINKKNINIYKASIAHLSKEDKKNLLKRLKYIFDNDYYCYSLTKSVVDQAVNLFSKFVSKHNCKDDIRNTINDLLILSTAIDREKKFRTRDKELNRFAAKYYQAPIAINKDNDELLIDFSQQSVESKENRESKGYINKGWSYVLRNNQPSLDP